MKSAQRGDAAGDLVCVTGGEEGRSGVNRRAADPRRRRVWWSVIYGNVKPRRRAPQRRIDDGYQSRDWHSSHLLAVAMGILLLSAADAFMTVTLLAGGAVEVNPVMAAVVYQSAGVFATLKMSLTGAGVILLVFLARYRFMRVIAVGTVMYAIFIAYAGLLGYEYWMFLALDDIPVL
jgi:hypothetical protein